MKINHIAFIMDGNRRWAKNNGLNIVEGHKKGANILEITVENCKKLGIREITFYGLSEENVKKRSKTELEYLFKIFYDKIKDLTKKALENHTCIRFTGDLSLLPKKLKELCENCQKQTKQNKNTILNLAIGYGGRQEIVNAVNKILEKPTNKITEEEITKNLYISSEPKLIIRTGGEKRASNFLTWQSTYSEWIFLNKNWPEFNLEDLKKCIQEYHNRKKNFGA